MLKTSRQLIYAVACFLSRRASQGSSRAVLYTLYKGFNNSYRTNWFDKQDAEPSSFVMFNSLTLSSCWHIQYSHHIYICSLNITNNQHSMHYSSDIPDKTHAASSSWILWFCLLKREARAYLLIPVTGTVHSVEFPLLETMKWPCPGRCAPTSHSDRS